MTLRYFCDRCNTLIQDKNITSLTFRNPVKSNTRYGCDSNLDLCSECYNDFTQYMKEKNKHK